MVQTRRWGWALQDLCRLVGSNISVRRVVESFFHGEARRWLAHLTLRTTVVSGEIGLLRHLWWLLLLWPHAHQQFIALGIRRCSHEIHQELSITVVTSGIRASRTLTGSSLALANEILKKLLGASSLWLGSRCKNLLNMLGRDSANRTVHSSIRSILLERRFGRGNGVRPTGIWRCTLRGGKRWQSWWCGAHRLFL